MSEIVSGFARALTALGEAGAEFVVVGVGGINFYARTPADAFATLDVDALLAPAIENLELALSVLSELGYEFEAGGEPFVDLDDRLVLRRILENGASLSAMHQEASEIDLMTSISGFHYSDLASDAATFEKAFETLGSDRAADLAEAAGIEDDPQEADECLRCHVTGYGLPIERFEHREPVFEDGIGCVSCHGAGKDFRNEEVMSDLERAKSKGLKIPTDEGCRVCHNEESPAWDPERFVLPDGNRVGFDFDQAVALIAHPIPPEVKGHYLELKKK